MRNRAVLALVIGAVAMLGQLPDRSLGQQMRERPVSPQFLHHRGNNYLDFGEFDLAIADFDAALRLDPGYTYARVSRGYAYLKKGDEDRALRDFEAVLQTQDPAFGQANHHASANHGLGTIALGHKAYDKAIARFTDAVQLNWRMPAAYVGRAEALVQQGRLDEALADVTRALWVLPQYGPPYRIRARIYRAQDRPLEAANDEMQARLLEAFDETRNLLVRGRDKTIPVDDSYSSGPGPPGQRSYGQDYPSLRKHCADDARQVLFVSMGVGMVAVRPAYAAAGGNISALPSDNGMAFVLGNEGCRIQVTIAKASDGQPKLTGTPAISVAHDAEPPLFEHRFYGRSVACVAATVRVRAFWGYVELIDDSKMSPNEHRWNNPPPPPGVTSHGFGDPGCEIEIRIARAD